MTYALLISATLLVASCLAGHRGQSTTAVQREEALNRHVQPYLRAVQAGVPSAQDFLTRADRRSWLLLESTLLTALPQLPYDARRRLVELMRERGTVARALRRTRLGGRGRALAAETLGTLAPDTCAQELVRLLADLDPEVRRAAIRGLGHSGAPAAATALVSGLGRRRGLEPAPVLHSLVRLGSVAVPGLLWGLDEPRPAVRAVCADALGLIGAHQAADPLTLLRNEDPDPEVRARAARALTRIEDPAPVPAQRAAASSSACNALLSAHGDTPSSSRNRHTSAS